MATGEQTIRFNGLGKRLTAVSAALALALPVYATAPAALADEHGSDSASEEMQGAEEQMQGAEEEMKGAEDEMNGAAEEAGEKPQKKLAKKPRKTLAKRLRKKLAKKPRKRPAKKPRWVAAS